MKRMSNSEFRAMLEERTVCFSAAVFRYLDKLPAKNSSRVIAFQLGKSASSIGANYHEATRAESADDFGHKLQIALKEAAESCYWLSILDKLYPTHITPRKLLDECHELRNLFQSITRTVRSGKTNSNTQTLKHSNTSPT